ncbi:ATP-binding protein [Pseudonocardia sp. NPDC046786]|uniref:ATP-binding protein n=1 Tax=Pseudonocardia sp. NPDC046786 TaxID=3155471 RepID=UPI0033C96A2C
MTPHRRLPTVLAVTGTVVVLVALATLLARGRGAEVLYGLFFWHNGPSAVVLLWTGRFVLSRRPGHGSGVVLMTIGWIHAVHTVLAAVADAALVRAGLSEPLTVALTDGILAVTLPLSATVPLNAMNWFWVPAAVLTAVALPALFPDGRLAGRTGRVAAVAGTLGAGLLVAASAWDAWPTATWAVADRPAGIGLLMALGGAAVLVGAAAALAGLAGRWRRADPAERGPYRVIGVVLVLFALVGVLTHPWRALWIPAMLVLINLLVVCYGVAAARYRLHEMEPVLGRTAVAVALSALVAVVYLAVVVGGGGLLGRLGGAAPDGALPVLAGAALVALLVEPVRRYTRRVTDRLLYRRDTDRLGVMSRLAARASGTASLPEVLHDVANLLVRSTGAARAEVWLDAARVAGSGTAPARHAELRVPIEAGDELLGELRLLAVARADLVRDAPSLLDDVARALGPVVRTARLADELQERLTELAESRRRLVEAHDAARRGIERDLHDGAQARLVALRMRIGALHAGTGDPRLAELGSEVDAVVRSLRDLARGLHPPLLDELGVAAALRAATRTLPVPVTVGGTGFGRRARAVETAVYFSCLEAVHNAVRHGAPTRIGIELTGGPDGPAFTVTDDGGGFGPGPAGPGTGLTNIADRVAALGGRVRIDGGAGAGTRVEGTLPDQPEVAER